ncbi:MAG: hypothetical protein FMNOHCHN_00157 [Ignavibacteriaceae bacterium]|nr:hypothetical protein [Ignavibacteriaceae bacterium]
MNYEFILLDWNIDLLVLRYLTIDPLNDGL